MILLVQPLNIGSAIRVLLKPPQGATRWRLLRKDTDDFSGNDDSSALLVHDGAELAVTDIAGLYNGHRVYYRAYYHIGNDWVASNTASGVPSAGFSDDSTDPLLLVRDRLDFGLSVYVERGQLAHSAGRIPVLTASPLLEQTPLPVVVVHLSSDSSSSQFIGGVMSGDYFDEDSGLWLSGAGWLSRWQLTIVGWSLNADERIVLRQAIKAVLAGNLEVFDAAGMVEVDVSFSDTEDFETYTAPLYMTHCTLTCLAPTQIGSTSAPIQEITILNRS